MACNMALDVVQINENRGKKRVEQQQQIKSHTIYGFAHYFLLKSCLN